MVPRLAIMVGPFSNFVPLELVQAKFPRLALQVLKCVSSVTLRLETGLMKMEARVWVTMFNYEFRLPVFPFCFAPLTMKDKF